MSIARRFYEGRGFVATGETMPYELDSVDPSRSR